MISGEMSVLYHNLPNLHTRTSFITQSNWDEIVEKFDDMHLRDELLRGIYAYGLVVNTMYWLIYTHAQRHKTHIHAHLPDLKSHQQFSSEPSYHVQKVR